MCWPKGTPIRVTTSLFRRRFLLILKRVLALAVLTIPLLAAQTGPVFRPGGPDAAKYGQAENYPKGAADHSDEAQNHAVGANSHFDELYPTSKVAHGPRMWNFQRAAAAPEIRYEFEGKSYTLNDFLDRVPVTGLLIARDDTILAETYQYARADRDRFDGHSMTKTFISMLMGIALGEHKIRLLAFDGVGRCLRLGDLARRRFEQPALRDQLLAVPGRASRYYGYGCQIWILPTDRRMFAMVGANGQYVFVDPKSKLVLVQTAVRLGGESLVSAHSEPLALWLAVVKQLG